MYSSVNMLFHYHNAREGVSHSSLSNLSFARTSSSQASNFCFDLAANQYYNILTILYTENISKFELSIIFLTAWWNKMFNDFFFLCSILQCIVTRVPCLTVFRELIRTRKSEVYLVTMCCIEQWIGSMLNVQYIYNRPVQQTPKHVHIIAETKNTMAPTEIRTYSC